MAQQRKIKKKVFSALFVALFAASPAYALSIANLSGQSQTVEVEDASQPSGFSSIEISSGATRRFDYGDMKVRFRGHESRLEYNMDYAIWKEGGISPQMTSHGSGNFE